MTLLKYFTLVIILITSISCSDKTVTDPDDYLQYLNIDVSDDTDKIEANYWTQRLNSTPNQYVYYAKRASALDKLFKTSGKINYLIDSQNDLIAANKATNYKNSGFLRALAHNYISQQRFKDALKVLKTSEKVGEKLKATQKMLFDVYLELGNLQEAEAYLNKIKNFSDFDYLIRLAKWEDHNGNLEGAISHMERATKITESSNNKMLKQWAYTNLADFYGHAGKLKLSYQNYLNALELDPQNAYAKKGIAWIVYSHENNPEQALKILQDITASNDSPDYALLKAEIAESLGNDKLQSSELNHFWATIQNTQYGEMYNAHSVLYCLEHTDMLHYALELSKKEVKNRPTAQSYSLLAWSHYKLGNIEKAVDIIDNNVFNKTFEPNVLYRVAEIYKTAGKLDTVTKLKQELNESIYELGPNMSSKIASL